MECMIIQARLTQPMGIIIAYLIVMPFGFPNVSLEEGFKLVLIQSRLSDTVEYVLISEAIIHFGGKDRVPAVISTESLIWTACRLLR